jgi:hypothetical protein
MLHIGYRFKMHLVILYFFTQPQAASTNPTTTVFVGNITDRASDAMIRQILMVSERLKT